MSGDIKRKFKFTAKIKGCPFELKEGMGKGVVLTQSREYSLTKEESESRAFQRELRNVELELLNENFEVLMEEVS